MAPAKQMKSRAGAAFSLIFFSCTAAYARQGKQRPFPGFIISNWLRPHAPIAHPHIHWPPTRRKRAHPPEHLRKSCRRDA